jgi:hypothetical protein
MRGVIVLLPILAFALAGQPPPASWDNVKTISPGMEIRVERSGLPKFMARSSALPTIPSS